MMVVEEADHDRDGVPSYLEDLNKNEYLLDDNTDEQSERNARTSLLVNFVDADDDNDLKPTKDEINIAEDGTVTFPDSDNDGTPDYLDADS